MVTSLPSDFSIDLKSSLNSSDDDEQSDQDYKGVKANSCKHLNQI